MIYRCINKKSAKAVITNIGYNGENLKMSIAHHDLIKTSIKVLTLEHDILDLSFPICFVGSKNEKEYVKSIIPEDISDNKAKIINLTGQTSISDLIDIINY